MKPAIFKLLLIPISLLFMLSCKQSDANKKYDADGQLADSLFAPVIRKMVMNDLASAVKMEDSIYFAQSNKSVRMQIIYHMCHSWANNANKNYEAAIKHCDSGIAVIQSHKVEKKESSLYLVFLTEKGLAYSNLSNYSKAYENYFKAKQLAEEQNDVCQKVPIQVAISLIQYRQQEYKQAANSYKEVLNYIHLCKNTDSIMHTITEQEMMDNVGLCYHKLKAYDSAKLYYTKALKRIKEISATTVFKDTNVNKHFYASATGVVLGNLAKVFMETNKPDTAESILKKAIFYNTTLGNEKQDAQLCMSYLAKVQLQQQKISEAKLTLDNLKKSLDTLPNIDAQHNWYDMMFAYYKATNATNIHPDFVNQYLAIKDTLNTKLKNSLEKTISQDMKDKEQVLQISLLQKSNQLSKTYLWVIAIVSILMVVIATLIYKNYRKGKRNIVTLTNLNNQIQQQQKITEDALGKLEVSNKDKDRILKVVAHDLRNPISGMVYMSKAVLEEEDAEQQAEMIKLIENTGNQSLLLISELLKINTIGKEKLDIKPVELNGLIKQTVASLQFKLEKKQQHIQLALPSTALIVNIDENKMERVINNLINNAIKFSPQNSQVNIAIETDEINFKILVKDAGIGIPEKMQTEIFEMFTNANREGTDGEKSFGIGLSICKQIVELHKGKIWVESEEGKGSSFIIQIPLGI